MPKAILPSGKYDAEVLRIYEPLACGDDGKFRVGKKFGSTAAAAIAIGETGGGYSHEGYAEEKVVVKMNGEYYEISPIGKVEFDPAIEKKVSDKAAVLAKLTPKERAILGLE